MFSCFDYLNQSVDDETVESLCCFLERVCEVFLQNKVKRSKYLSIEYIETTIQNTLALRTNDNLSSRIKFRILDFKDLYEKNWKSEIAKTK